MAELRPLAPPALLGATAVATGGLAGVIIGFVAALLAIDRLLDHLGGFGRGTAEAERSFARLARRRRGASLARRLHQGARGAKGLAYLADDSGWPAQAQRRRLGVQPIPIDSIVGTSDAHKAVSFDGEFRPPAWSRGRWTALRTAAQRGTPLPPISVYRVGDRHYVRDGHHRVSVARSLGATRIDADVVELVAARSGGEALGERLHGRARRHGADVG
jgi:hypothetical protein